MEPDPAATIELLINGQLELVGRLTDASNATFLCRVTGDNEEALCVYKPRRGERPLDDFPAGTLGNRERAAYLLSEATGWSIVPPTVLREGPHGPGMVQAWIDVDATADVLEMVMTGDPRLRPVALLDAMSNNADRKGGHLLPVESGAIYGVDHGICFNVEPKLRTVLWAWRGTSLTSDELSVVLRVAAALEGELRSALCDVLDEREVQATVQRTRALLDSARFPEPDPSRPAVPWPPF